MADAAPTSLQARFQEVLRVARSLYKQRPDWVTFFREVLSVDGIARQTLGGPEEFEAFEQSEAHDEIQTMIADLRIRGGDMGPAKEPVRVITVRLPKSLHETLRNEAYERKTSMNKLCISKLLQVVRDQQLEDELEDPEAAELNGARTLEEE